MIAKTGESTISPAETVAGRSIFRHATTEELLKYLLDVHRDGHESAGCRDAPEEAGESSRQMKSDFCDKCDPSDNNCRLATACGGYETLDHGIMSREHGDGDDTWKIRENLQRNPSEDGSQHEQLSDEDASGFAGDILGSDTLDFILSGTEKNLCIQTPSPQENTSECADFSELFSCVAESASQEALAPVASTSGTSGAKASTSDGKTDKEKEDDDGEDANDAMVLVPSGKCREIDRIYF